MAVRVPSRASASLAGTLGLFAVLAGTARAAESSAERLYVSDETGGNVVIVDPQQARVVARIPVGKRPRGIQLSPDQRKVYVALSGSPIAGPNVDESKLPPPDRRYDGVGVVDVEAQKLIHTYPSGIDPEAFALSHDGGMLYVSNEDSGQLSAIDLTRGTLRAQVKVGSEPEGVAVSQDEHVVFVTCETSNDVYVIDTGSMKVLATVATEKRPRAFFLDARAHRGFVTDEFGAALTEFSTVDYKVLRTIPLGDPKVVRPMGIASRDGRRLYITTGRFGALLEVDAESGRILRTIEKIGTRPWGIALNHDGSKAFTANGPSGDVSVIDLTSGRIEARIPVGGSPWGVVASHGEAR